MALEIPDGLLSYADYAAIDDGQRYQVIDGVLVMSPAATLWHQIVVQRISNALFNQVEATEPEGLVVSAPTDLVLRFDAPAIVLQPDVMYISPARRGLLKKANIQGAPDLAVEVLSPSTAMLDLTRKRGLYLKHGVREYWAVYIDQRRIDVITTTGVTSHDERLETDLLPGFSLDVQRLFRDLPAD